MRKMIDSKTGGEEKSINENTINNIKANTQWIDVRIYLFIK
jgi:predicted small metal-binding protein